MEYTYSGTIWFLRKTLLIDACIDINVYTEPISPFCPFALSMPLTFASSTQSLLLVPVCLNGQEASLFASPSSFHSQFYSLTVKQDAVRELGCPPLPRGIQSAHPRIQDSMFRHQGHRITLLAEPIPRQPVVLLPGARQFRSVACPDDVHSHPDKGQSVPGLYSQLGQAQTESLDGGLDAAR